MRHNRVFIFLLLCVVLLSACAPTSTYTGTADGLGVTVTTNTALITNQSIPLMLQFTRAGAAVPVTDVAVELVMPGMVMGKNVPLATAQPDGSQRVDVLFTMDGEWSLLVTGKTDGTPFRVVIPQVIVAP